MRAGWPRRAEDVAIKMRTSMAVHPSGGTLQYCDPHRRGCRRRRCSVVVILVVVVVVAAVVVKRLNACASCEIDPIQRRRDTACIICSIHHHGMDESIYIYIFFFRGKGTGGN